MDYIFLNPEPKKQWTLHFGYLYLAMLKESGENWKKFDTFKLEFPTSEELKQAKSVIIGGSSTSAYEEKDFEYALTGFIVNAYWNYPHLKWVGICYGHQKISHALGGQAKKLQNLPPDLPFLFRREVISITEDFKLLPYVQLSNEFEGYKGNKVALIVSHGDEAVKPISGMKNVKVHGKSEYTKHEILTGDRILTVQGHPEFTPSFVLEMIYSGFVRENRELEEVRRRSKESYYSGEM